ncbi:MAG: ABC transporter ATP-binding protein, partial [Desulfobacterales bacterium]|nr:ABC transporter ATP-binding protein [Desulfobacterales bacterium]
VCIVGPNGAGKSTFLKSVAGMINTLGGSINFCGKPIEHMPGHKICRLGISYISEEMNLFAGMNIQENLAMGAFTVEDKNKILEHQDFVFDLFPILKKRRKQLAGTMSGGERKMLAIGRGLMSGPSLLLVDEPSLGLAPQLTDTVFQALDVLHKKGVTILLVEQNVTKTLKATDRGYVLEKGKIVIEGPSSELNENEHVRKAYLGI